MLSLFWVTTLLALSGMIISYLVPYLMRGQKMAAIGTLSGRMEFWPEVLKKIWDAPILGHGFYASQRVMWNVSTVDNTYLEVILGVGLVGLIGLCIPLLSIIINLWKTRPWKTGVSLNSPIRFIWIQMASIFIIVFIRSLTGPSFQILHISLIIFVILIIGSHRLRALSSSSVPHIHSIII
jgi:O-antigen ligase